MQTDLSYIVLCKRSGPVRSGPNPAGPRASPVHGLPRATGWHGPGTPVQFGEERPRPVSNPSGSDPHGLARSGSGPVRSGPVGLVRVFFWGENFEFFGFFRNFLNFFEFFGFFLNFFEFFGFFLNFFEFLRVLAGLVRSGSGFGPVGSGFGPGGSGFGPGGSGFGPGWSGFGPG